MSSMKVNCGSKQTTSHYLKTMILMAANICLIQVSVHKGNTKIARLVNWIRNHHLSPQDDIHQISNETKQMSLCNIHPLYWYPSTAQIPSTMIWWSLNPWETMIIQFAKYAPALYGVTTCYTTQWKQKQIMATVLHSMASISSIV